MTKPTNILVISASGMGCTIMFTPTLKAIKKMYPQCLITFLVTSESFAAPVRDSYLVDEVLVFNFPKDSLFKITSLLSRIKFILNLRKRSFEYCLTVFPSNKWYFNAFAWLSGAKKRITHSYETSKIKNLSFLQNIKIPANKKLHDVEQNFNLIRAFTGSPPKLDEELFFNIPEENQLQARKFIETSLAPNKNIIGMHIGSSKNFSFEAKRWPLENFAKLADKIKQQYNAEICIFFGPNEEEDIEKILKLMDTKPHIVKFPIKTTAAIIKNCQLMISNDSGLMHIAVALQTPVIAIFGPTTISRTHPYTENAEIVYDKQNHSIFKYPFTTTTAELDHEKAKKCFDKITVEMVFASVKKKLGVKKNKRDTSFQG